MDDLMSGEEQCRMCGWYLKSHLPLPFVHAGWPQPLLPGDIPARREVCDRCVKVYGPFPDEPYTPSWASWSL